MAATRRAGARGDRRPWEQNCDEKGHPERGTQCRTRHENNSRHVGRAPVSTMSRHAEDKHASWSGHRRVDDSEWRTDRWEENRCWKSCGDKWEENRCWKSCGYSWKAHDDNEKLTRRSKSQNPYEYLDADEAQYKARPLTVNQQPQTLTTRSRSERVLESGAFREKESLVEVSMPKSMDAPIVRRVWRAPNKVNSSSTSCSAKKSSAEEKKMLSDSVSSPSQHHPEASCVKAKDCNQGVCHGSVEVSSDDRVRCQQSTYQTPEDGHRTVEKLVDALQVVLQLHRATQQATSLPQSVDSAKVIEKDMPGRRRSAPGKMFQKSRLSSMRRSRGSRRRSRSSLPTRLESTEDINFVENRTAIVKTPPGEIQELSNSSFDKPFPPNSCCWDWPLSRQERKARVALMDMHLSRIDREQLIEQLQGQRPK